jgi:hypothetical protein
MALVSQSKFATLAGVTRQSISSAIKNGSLTKRPDGKLDTNNPVNSGYLQLRAEKTKPRPTPPPPDTKPDEGVDTSPVTHVSLEDLANIANIESLEAFSKSSIDRLKTIEQVKQLQTKVMKERGLLIDRALVKKVFSQIYTIDVNEFRTLAPNAAPEIGAAVGVDDDATLLQIEEIINSGVFSILEHVKRIIDDFLNEVGG